MDSVSGARQSRSGDEIVRPPQTAAVRTAYDLPARDPPQQNPSWISRLVYKPASVIASGAGKFISSVVFSDSSSSSSSEDEDSSSDTDGDEDVDKNITQEDFVNEQQSRIQPLSSKRVIEKLLMQETFAKEEGDRLIDIIKARVLDHPSALAAAVEGRHSDNRLTNDVNVGETSNKAVMEARKLLEEKKSRSSSKYNANEDGVGSLVDVAKSYMQSPSSSSSAGTQLLKEGTLFTYSAENFSSSKLKRKPGSYQSWNIQDEIRKVRAKATDEMLKSPSSVASLEPKLSPYALATDVPKGNVASLNADGGDEAVNDFNNHSSTIGNTTNAALALGETLDQTGNFCIPKDVFRTSKEADELGAACSTASNGFSSSSPSSPVAIEGQPKPKAPDETEASQPIAETPGDDITVGNDSEGAVNNENNDSDSSASHNSYFKHA